MENINSKQFKKMLDDNPNKLELVDVREQFESDEIRVKNSKLIPMNDVLARKDEIDWDKKVVFICRSGARSGYVAGMLAQAGKETINLDGGIYELNLDNCECLERGR